MVVPSGETSGGPGSGFVATSVPAERDVAVVAVVMPSGVGACSSAFSGGVSAWSGAVVAAVSSTPFAIDVGVVRVVNRVSVIKPSFSGATRLVGGTTARAGRRGHPVGKPRAASQVASCIAPSLLALW
jgi:hypothetical protein